jgi:hypothetical protein
MIESMDHHYCPCFYTKQWTNTEGKLLHYTIVYGKIISRHVTPTGTGFETDLYAKIGTSALEKHTIETEYYKEIDNNAAAVLQKIIKEGLENLSITEEIAWCRFIVSMLTRHPTVVNNAKNMEENVINRQIQLFPTHQQAYYNIQFKKEIEYFKKNIAVETLANMATLQSKYDIGMCERYVDALLNMSWKIIDFRKTSFKLLTSDYPVVLSPFHPNAKKYDKISDLLLSGDYLLSLPLTPSLCFYASTDKNKIITNHNQLIKLQNNVTVLKAKNFVYASDKSQESFIRKRLFSRIKEAAE